MVENYMPATLEDQLRCDCRQMAHIRYGTSKICVHEPECASLKPAPVPVGKWDAIMSEARQHLPESAEARKLIPLATGLIDYFPDALIAVAGVSKIGSEQHNPGQPCHWDRSKSADEDDCLLRHFVDRGTIDTDGVRHSAKVAWRALALLQKEIEAALD